MAWPQNCVSDLPESLPSCQICVSLVYRLSVFDESVFWHVLPTFDPLETNFSSPHERLLFSSAEFKKVSQLSVFLKMEYCFCNRTIDLVFWSVWCYDL